MHGYLQDIYTLMCFQHVHSFTLHIAPLSLIALPALGLSHTIIIPKYGDPSKTNSLVFSLFLTAYIGIDYCLMDNLTRNGDSVTWKTENLHRKGDSVTWKTYQLSPISTISIIMFS